MNINHFASNPLDAYTAATLAEYRTSPLTYETLAAESRPPSPELPPAPYTASYSRSSTLISPRTPSPAPAATARTPTPEPTTAEKAAREAAEKARRAAKDATEAPKAADAPAHAATPKPEPKSWMEWMTGQTDPAEQKKTIAVVVITALVSRLKVFR